MCVCVLQNNNIYYINNNLIQYNDRIIILYTYLKILISQYL